MGLRTKVRSEEVRSASEGSVSIKGLTSYPSVANKPSYFIWWVSNLLTRRLGLLPSQRHPKLENQPSHKQTTKLYAAGWFKRARKKRPRGSLEMRKRVTYIPFGGIIVMTIEHTLLYRSQSMVFGGSRCLLSPYAL